MIPHARFLPRLGTALAGAFLLACSAPSDETAASTPLVSGEPIATQGDLALLAAAAPAPPLETGPMAVYVVVANRGTVADTLVGVSSPAAARGSVHESWTDDGVSGMGPAGAVAVEPNDTLRMTPGGLHVMLDDLNAPLVAGDSLTLTLEFSRGGGFTITLPVVTYGDVPDLLGPYAPRPEHP